MFEMFESRDSLLAATRTYGAARSFLHSILTVWFIFAAVFVATTKTMQQSKTSEQLWGIVLVEIVYFIVYHFLAALVYTNDERRFIISVDQPVWLRHMNRIIGNETMGEFNFLVSTMHILGALRTLLQVVLAGYSMFTCYFAIWPEHYIRLVDDSPFILTIVAYAGVTALFIWELLPTSTDLESVFGIIFVIFYVGFMLHHLCFSVIVIVKSASPTASTAASLTMAARLRLLIIRMPVACSAFFSTCPKFSSSSSAFWAYIRQLG
jgi:hypothetical protein